MWLLFWIGFCIIPALIASNKGRSAAGWFFGSLLISPLLGAIIVACLSPIRPNVERDALASGEMKKCPQCAELVKYEAKICRFCRHEFPMTNQAAIPSPPKKYVPINYVPDQCPSCGARQIVILSLDKYYGCQKCGREFEFVESSPKARRT